MAGMVTGHIMLWRFSDLNRDSIRHLFNCLLILGHSSIQTRIARMLAWWPGTEIGWHAVDWRGCQAGRERLRQLSLATTSVGSSRE